MKYDTLLYNRRNFIQLSEHMVELAHEKQDWQLLELVDLAMVFYHMLNNWAHLLELIAEVNSKWQPIIANELAAYKEYKKLQESHTRRYNEHAEYEYDIDCQCLILKNTPKYHYDSKH